MRFRNIYTSNWKFYHLFSYIIRRIKFSNACAATVFKDKKIYIMLINIWKTGGHLGNFLVSFSISFVFLPKSKPKAQAHNSYLYCNTTSNGILLLQSATCVALLPLLRPHGSQPSPIRKWSVNGWSILLLRRSMIGFHVLETKGVRWWTESTKNISYQLVNSYN